MAPALVWVAAAPYALIWLATSAGGPIPTILQWGVTAGAACIYVIACRLGIRSLSLSLAAGGLSLLALLSKDVQALRIISALLMFSIALGLGSMCARSPWWMRVFVVGVLIAAAINSAIALVQMTFPSLSGVAWIASSPYGDAYGNLRQRNQFASLINIALLAVLWVGRNRESRSNLVAFTVAAFLLGALNAASSSRTGALQLGVMAVAVLLLKAGHRHCRATILAAVLGFAVAGLALLMPSLPFAREPALSRMLAESSGCSSRVVLWRNVVDLILERPWSGWGLGELDYAHYVTPYVGTRFCEILDNAHNLPLQIAVEMGLPIALLALVLLIGVVYQARPWAEQDSTRQLAWGILGLIAMHSMVEYPLWYGPFLFTAGIATGIVSTGCLHKSIKASGFLDAMRAGLAAGMFAVICIVALDYQRISQIYLPYTERDPQYRDNTLQKIQNSWLFRDQVRFAELVTTPLTGNNAEHTYRLAQGMLHFSPEPRVIEQLISSARLTGRNHEAAFHEARFAAAFPAAYAAWHARRNSK